MTSLAYLHDCHSRYDERSIVQKKNSKKNLPTFWRAGVASGFGRKDNIVGVQTCLFHHQLRQSGKTCVKSKRTKMSFPLFVPPGVTNRGMLRVSLNGCTVCYTLSCPRMHSIHLSANPPRHLGIVLSDPQGSRRDMHILV